MNPYSNLALRSCSLLKKYWSLLKTDLVLAEKRSWRQSRCAHVVECGSNLGFVVAPLICDIYRDRHGPAFPRLYREPLRLLAILRLHLFHPDYHHMLQDLACNMLGRRQYGAFFVLKGSQLISAGQIQGHMYGTNSQ